MGLSIGIIVGIFAGLASILKRRRARFIESRDTRLRREDMARWKRTGWTLKDQIAACKAQTPR